MAFKFPDVMIEEWEMPHGYGKADIKNRRSLPDGWSQAKCKVFHLMRQVYGQMVATDRKYGVIHLYERWWFCCRTDNGDILISDPLKYTDTSPSVFQAIYALALQNDHIMPHADHEEDPKPPSKTGPEGLNFLQKFVRRGCAKRGQPIMDKESLRPTFS
jgi:hypothetical protein